MNSVLFFHSGDCMSIDAKRIRDGYKLVSEVNEVIGIWEIWIEDCPVNPLKVKVLRLHPQESYMGKANYSIQNPEQASPYRSLHPHPTPQKALEDAISGFFAFYKPELKEQTKFIKDEDF